MALSGLYSRVALIVVSWLAAASARRWRLPSATEKQLTCVGVQVTYFVVVLAFVSLGAAIRDGQDAQVGRGRESEGGRPLNRQFELGGDNGGGKGGVHWQLQGKGSAL